MRKNSSGFFILSRIRFLAALAVLVLGVLAAQFHPGHSLGAQSAPLAHGSQADVLKLIQAERSLVATPEPSPPPAAPESRAAKKAPQKAPIRPELVGTAGYAVAGGNCVAEPGINNPGYGNPSDWPVTSQVPRVGATAVFTWNHVGVVTGIWRNGDIEVRHQNYWGGQHRFPRSMIRGFR